MTDTGIIAWLHISNGESISAREDTAALRVVRTALVLMSAGLVRFSRDRAARLYSAAAPKAQR